MSRHMPYEPPKGLHPVVREALNDLEDSLDVLEDLASVVGLIFHAGSERGELTPVQCYGGMRLAGQIEERLTKAYEAFKAMEEALTASGRGGAA